MAEMKAAAFRDAALFAKRLKRGGFGALNRSP